MCSVLRSDLAQIGIELELIKLETAALKGILNDAALDYDLCLYQFTDNLGTDFTLRNQFGSYEDNGVLKKNGSVFIRAVYLPFLRVLFCFVSLSPKFWLNRFIMIRGNMFLFLLSQQPFRAL